MVKWVITVVAAPRLTVDGIVYPSCLVISYAKSSNLSYSAVSMSLESAAWGWYASVEGFSPQT